MKLPVHPAAAAAVITGAALALPCGAWYLAGSRAAIQEAQIVRQAPGLEAREEAQRIAQRIAVRLESLRQSEERRSFLDYETDESGLPKEACELHLPSPLAQGPADPLIWTHFQIDEVGQLTLPSLDAAGLSDASRERAREALSKQQAILEALECAAPDALTLLPPPTGAAREQQLQRPDRDWVISVGPLRWNTLEVDDEHALVALRKVKTPTTALTQGFVIRPRALEELLGSSSPAEVRPGPPSRPTDAGIPLDDVSWTVAIDASEAMAGAAAAADQILAKFRRIFLGGLLAAVLAGSLVVGLVWQADRLARQRARFAASAAHELRTPLTGLRMYGEMLAEGTGDAAQAGRYARRIAGEAERLGRVVSNLLSFSKLERGELALHARPGDLASAVQESLDQLRPALEASGAKVQTAVNGSMPEVRFDRDAVHQILQNLLDNAEKYSRSSRDRTLRVGLDRAPGGINLSVADRGPGVEASLRHRLFQPFVRHPSPDAPPGLGLGLALVQALARAQNATVFYAEGGDGGARFTVSFPAVS